MNHVEAVKVLREALIKLLPLVRDLYDTGLHGSEWQSDKLISAIVESDDALAATENIERKEIFTWLSEDYPVYVHPPTVDHVGHVQMKDGLVQVSLDESIMEFKEGAATIYLYPSPQPTTRLEDNNHLRCIKSELKSDFDASPQPANADVVVPNSLKVIALLLEYEKLMDSENHHAGMLKYAELHEYCKMFEKIVAAPSTDKP